MGTKLMHSLFRLFGFGSCVEIKETCYEYSEGNLGGRQQQRVKRHLKICPQCLRFVISYAAVRAMGKTLHPEKLTEKQKAKLLEGLNLDQ